MLQGKPDLCSDPDIGGRQVPFIVGAVIQALPTLKRDDSRAGEVEPHHVTLFHIDLRLGFYRLGASCCNYCLVETNAT